MPNQAYGELPTTVLLAIQELKATAERPGSLEEKLRATMKEAHHHWLVTDAQERFKAAVGAVLLVVDRETQQRISTELRGLARISATIGALQAGVPLDLDGLEAMAAEQPAAEDLIGLNRLWHETADKSS